VARTKVVLNQKAVQSEILRGNDVMKHLEALGSRIAGAAGPDFVVTRKRQKTRDAIDVRDSTERSFFRETQEGNLRRAVQSVRSR
jgi:hypothetical protein